MRRDTDGRMQYIIVFGKVEEFDGNREDWTQYVKRLGHFFDASSITESL